MNGYKYGSHLEWGQVFDVYIDKLWSLNEDQFTDKTTTSYSVCAVRISWPAAMKWLSAQPIAVYCIQTSKPISFYSNVNNNCSSSLTFIQSEWKGTHPSNCHGMYYYDRSLHNPNYTAYSTWMDTLFF